MNQENESTQDGSNQSISDSNSETNLSNNDDKLIPTALQRSSWYKCGAEKHWTPEYDMLLMKWTV